MNTSRAEATVELRPIQERVRSTANRLEAGLSQIDNKIHRIPPGLRGIGDRYIVPSVVALGPYHHGSPHLHQMEEIKHVAAYYFCKDSGRPVEEVYAKILSVAIQVRCFYDEDAVARFSDTEFADMMFLDGCFLLEYIGANDVLVPVLANTMVLSTGPCMLRDIMLLENQLPWLVLEVLMTFKHVDVSEFILGNIRALLRVKDRPGEVYVNGDYRAPHFLGLARLYLTGDTAHGEENQSRCGVMSILSAIQLAEMSVKLKDSDATMFADMIMNKNGCLYGELSLSPVFLNEYTACWLINMAAFETCTSTGYPSDGFVVSSYLSILAMLMDKEEDVHELRAQHIVQSYFSNQETLNFFKVIARHLRLGNRCFIILEAIEDYKQKRRVWIVVHRFLYHNWKNIVALISIVSVLVGVFKTLLSLKYH
ncbi:UPF0481 protein At3g47200-like [Phragmites australis]|uniref:UPF0481 protein At3g47200-like n=1 Tax=Phragmites australis TaxID=29695 RepID=UPI002D76E513|nr:UPF0481 protein At3g47200-like [Phragmites australis]